MLRHYTLVGQTPVPEPDLLTWARSFEENDRRVAKTCIFDVAEVSTIFLGLDHNWGNFGRDDCEGPPLLFETMIFWADDGWDEQWRCSTWSEAEEMHAWACREAASLGALWRYFLRRIGSTLQEMRKDWRALWTQL